MSLTGYQNGHTIDQVFFGMFFYDFNRDTGQFAPHLNTLDHAFSGNDDNNVLIVLSEATTPEDYVPTSTDDSAVLDMVESGGKEMLYQMAIFDESDGDARFDHYAYYDEGGKTDRVWTCDERNVDWDDKYRTFDGVIGNFQPIAGQDEDAFFMKLVGHEFTYSAPVIQAVVLSAAELRGHLDGHGVRFGFHVAHAHQRHDGGLQRERHGRVRLRHRLRRRGAEERDEVRHHARVLGGPGVQGFPGSRGAVTP